MLSQQYSQCIFGCSSDQCIKGQGNLPVHRGEEMISISVCMIVKNEEEVLARCLDCVKQFADEIVVVDTGSSDTTKEIAKQYTDFVYDFAWCDDFSEARNFAFEKATKDFSMWIDADDVVLEHDITKINDLKQRLNSSVDIVLMKYHTAFDAQGNPTFTYYRERLINRNRNLVWTGVIHEVIPLMGKLQYEDIAITHKKMHVADPDRNLRIFENMLKQGKTLNPREQFYYARELYYHRRYADAIEQFETFLDGNQGWIENNIDACEMMGYCFYYVDKEEEALKCYFRSFVYDVPRAEICCDIGQHLFDRQQWKQAKYWFERALACEMNVESGGFVRRECYGEIPKDRIGICDNNI